MALAKCGVVRCSGIALVLGMTMHSQVAHAASECEQNYSTASGSQGGVIHQSFVGLYGGDTVAATGKLKAAANSQGFQTVSGPDTGADGLVTLVVAQKASANARGFPVVIMVSPETDAAVIAFQLPNGMTSPDAKGNMCSLFDAAGLKGLVANSSRHKAARNSALAMPLLATLSGTKSAEQAARDSVSASGVPVNSASASASGGNDRGAAPALTDRRKVVRPKASFNPAEEGLNLHAEGNSTIKGLTCERMFLTMGAELHGLPNKSIILFPYSPYLKEAISLIDANRNRGDKVRVAVDQRAFASGLAGKTNANGAFQFTRLKPGRYLVMAGFEDATSGYRISPQSSSDGSTGTVYEWTDYDQFNAIASDILQADVTISHDGQTVDGVVVKAQGNGRVVPLFDAICKLHLDK